MANPQSGIFVNSPQHYLLEYKSKQEQSQLRACLRSLCDFIQNQSDSEVVIAWSAACHLALGLESMPRLLRDMQPIEGPSGRIAPATQADLAIWIHGTRHDLNFKLARQLHACLRESFTLEREVHGFVYLDSRDLTGFIDGTENPEGEEAREVALLPDTDPNAGGSYLLLQKWIHQLDAFNALSTRVQEGVIGRTKADSVELSDTLMPETSHVSRVDYSQDDQAIELYRRSVPFGTVKEHGLQFIAFAADPNRFQLLLERMFGASEDGIEDRLTHFSNPVSGSYLYAPSLEELRFLSV